MSASAEAHERREALVRRAIKTRGRDVDDERERDLVTLDAAARTRVVEKIVSAWESELAAFAREPTRLEGY